MPSSRPHSVRIISGTWRRRRLRFPPVDGLRPTPDRVKETLFNWLGSRVEGARCLDLFAGTGSLGFEAASRGARAVTMVEYDFRLAKWLEEQSRVLAAPHIEVQRIDAQLWLTGPHEPFDIVFLDPPFKGSWLADTCARLSTAGCLRSDAMVYLECERELDPLPVPTGFEIVRNRTAGQVRYYLAARRAG